MSKGKKNAVVLVTVFMMSLMYAASVSAQLSAFHLWGDEDKVRCDWFPPEPFTVMHMYLFLTPGRDGAFAAEYKLITPPGHFAISSEPGPMFSGASIGNPAGPPGISVSFIMCQVQEVLVWKFQFMAQDLTPGYYIVGPHEDTGFLGVAICAGDRPMQEGYLYGQFGYHADGFCRFGVEESSWGAVKSLYR